MSQHASVTEERWRKYSDGQQILMIANEMHRAAKLYGSEDLQSLRRALERVLRLADLTAAVTGKSGLRRELLRWRELVAAIYVTPSPDLDDHRALLRVLLLLNPEAARQVPFIAPHAPERPAPAWAELL